MRSNSPSKFTNNPVNNKFSSRVLADEDLDVMGLSFPFCGNLLYGNPLGAVL